MVNMTPPTLQMNLSVLKRYSPSITAVVSTASYAVVYIFNSTTVTWDRANIEGTLFIVALNNSNPYLSSDHRGGGKRRRPPHHNHHKNHSGPDEYQLVILSRRGLENFIIPLTSPEDIETSEKFVILRSSTKCGSIENVNCEEEGEPRTYGLWVWGEIDTVAGDKERIEKIVRELSERVVKSASKRQSSSITAAPQREPTPQPAPQLAPQLAPQPAPQLALQPAPQPAPQPAHQAPQQQQSYEEENGDSGNASDEGNGVGVGIPGAGGVPMSARSISLTDLFNQQRKEDEDFSRHPHLYNPQQQPPNHIVTHSQTHSLRQAPQPHHLQSQPQSQSQQQQQQQQQHILHPHYHYQIPYPHQPPYLPQSFESYYQHHPQNHPYIPHPHPHPQFPQQRPTPASSSSTSHMPPPPNFLPTPAPPQNQPSAYPTPPLAGTQGHSRPQSQSQLPPVVNYHLGYGGARGQEYNGGGNGGGVGLNGASTGTGVLGVSGSNEVLARLFQSASAGTGTQVSGGSSGSASGNGNGGGGGGVSMQGQY